mmetsp:Transcript_4297/g.13425  ORF Transcript_4297/g.13425 Transcript_4297/m.13425 type:complete len:478 (+) Transcript_4297:484-1917(+)
MAPPRTHTQYDADVIDYLNAAQSAFHCVAECKRRLTDAGFVELDERKPWTVEKGGKYVITRNGSTLVAFAVGGAFDADTSGAICLGAHTDSPCPKLKPISRLEKAGATMLGVVGYGGGLWHTWFDRDLTLTGRALVRRGARLAHELLTVDRAVCRIPTLAIHLSQGDERTTFKPNLQSHLPPMLATGLTDALAGDGAAARHDALVVGLAAEALGCAEADIVELELQLADAQPSALIGARREFISSGRLDNQASCYCGTTALVESLDSLEKDASLRVLAMFDHEEVGSLSQQGAQSPTLRDVLARAYAAAAPRGDFRAFLARSFQISSDMAHGQHPNYADRHDPKHAVALQKGLVIKHNANQRYATNAVGAAFAREFARRVGVPIQDFAVKADSACGTTIGPITAGGVGLRTVDVGPPQLSMHSIREIMGADDVYFSVKTFVAAYEHFHEVNKAVDVDGPDPFWSDPGKGWATAVGAC